jgi:2-desacetyl-2-hydroxyethyl bacteriochlorophyllide A dehydrogenase
MNRRALVVDRPGQIAVVDRPALAAGASEVLIRPAFVGLCGTDVELLDGAVDPDFVRYPLTLGHEWSGVVEAVGEGVESVAPGDRVVAEGIVPCGECPACRRGATNVCAVYDELGFTREGAASDQIVVPSRLVHRLGDGVPLIAGALVEPASVVLQALDKIGIDPGDRVLVIGDGTIALLAAHLAGLWSPAAVEMAGLRAPQAPLATAVGATTFHAGAQPADLADRFDVVVEAAGAPAAILSATQAVRRGGRVVLLGYAGSGVTVPLPVDDLVNDDLTIATSFGYTARSWKRVVGLLNAGVIEPATIVTHRYPLEDHAAAFEALRAGQGDGARGKVVLELERSHRGTA